MKKTKYFLAFLAAVMVLTAGVGQAMAYFTTYTEVKGLKVVRIGDETTITEKFADWTKELTIRNEEGSQPVYVRAKVFKPDALNIECPYEGSDSRWGAKSDDDYYYYSDALAAGESAGVLKVHISNIPVDAVKGDTFNVIVVYESTPVLYREDGSAYADWNSELVIVGESESKPDTPSVPDKDVKPDTGNGGGSGTENAGESGTESNTDHEQNNGKGGSN